MNPDLAEVCGIHAGDGYLRNDGTVSYERANNNDNRKYRISLRG